MNRKSLDPKWQRWIVDNTDAGGEDDGVLVDAELLADLSRLACHPTRFSVDGPLLADPSGWPATLHASILMRSINKLQELCGCT